MSSVLLDLGVQVEEEVCLAIEHPCPRIAALLTMNRSFPGIGDKNKKFIGNVRRNPT